MKVLLRVATAAVALVSVAGTASAEGGTYGFEIHMAPADYSGCTGIVDADLDCGSIDPVGEEFTEQFAWVIAWGWENSAEWPEGAGIGGVQFAVRYPKDVSITGWSLCSGGSEIPVDNPVDGTWPQSETGIAATWSGGEYMSTSGFAKVGFLVVSDGSFGTLEIVPHVTTDLVEITSGPSGGLTTIVAGEGSWGRADVDGTEGDTYVVCAKVPTESTTWSAIKSMY